MQDDLLVARPTEAAISKPELLLLFHGVGARAEDLQPLGEMLAVQRPAAWVVSVRSPQPSDLGQGWQWFSVRGVTEANRIDRVAEAMPAFVDHVATWQRHSGVPPERTTLIGFSQGAIMALESTQLDRPPATRVVALSGRFAQLPRRAHAALRTHLVHGDADPVMPVRAAIDALARLQSLGAVATLDRLPGLGHSIDARVVNAIVRRLDGPSSATI